MVVMSPAPSTLRMRPLIESVMNIFPAPTTVVMVPDVSILRMQWL
jgi:hypothetical protein